MSIIDFSVADKNLSALNSEQKRLFKQMLDPNHDIQIDPVGYADMLTGNTVVRKITKQRNFSVVAGQSHMVFLTQLLSGHGTSVGKNAYALTTGGHVLEAGNTNSFTGVPYGGVIVVNESELESEVFNIDEWDSTAIGSINCYTDGDDYFEQLIEGPSPPLVSKTRAVGMAIEIIPTTPRISLGGSLTMFRLPSPLEDGEITVRSVVDGDVLYEESPFRFLTPYPRSIGIARTLPDSRSWEFAKGLYMPARLNNALNPAEMPFTGVWGTSQQLGYQAIPTADFATWGNIVSTLRDTNIVASDVAYSNGGCGYMHNFDPCGAIISAPAGADQSYTLKYTVFLEEIPPVTVAGSAYAQLGKPSPWYDPTLIELIARTMCQMPVGTPVNNNASGDWFRSVARVGGEVLNGMSRLYKVAESTGLLPREVRQLVKEATKVKKDVQKVVKTTKKTANKVKQSKKPEGWFPV